MRKAVFLFLFNVCFPVFTLLAAPAWLVRMARRGGLSAKLWERVGRYDREAESEVAGAIYFHAVSVGEMVMALKLVETWRKRDPERHFILSATTSTGYDLAVARAGENTRVIYSPLDVPILIRRMLARFDPAMVVLVDSELWPNLLNGCHRRGVPLALVNARLSPRSEHRHRRFNKITRPFLGMLDFLGAQAPEHARTWEELGVAGKAISVTGSVKFDAGGQALPVCRPEFAKLLDAFGPGRSVVLLASSHAGEEAWVAEALADHPDLIPVIVPRHAERRDEVAADLAAVGRECILKTRFAVPRQPEKAVLVADTTGELRDWTAHADVVVIGKSILGRGGQNPTEAIAAGKPVLTGPHMGNFEPLVTQLREAGGLGLVETREDLVAEVASLLGDAQQRRVMTESARKVLGAHEGACERTVDLLHAMLGK